MTRKIGCYPTVKLEKKNKMTKTGLYLKDNGYNLYLINLHSKSITSAKVRSGFPFVLLAIASPRAFKILFPGFHPNPVSRFGNKLNIPKRAS